MISIKNYKELKLIKEGGAILAKVLKEVSGSVKPGITANSLNKLAKELIFSYGAKPSFEGYVSGRAKKDPYPAALCTSINNEVVHAIPSDRVLREGDIISLDLGVLYKGYFTDMAVTVGVGEISEEIEKLIEVTKGALAAGIKKIKPGNYIGDIGSAISNFVEPNGFSVVRQLVGHGVGYAVHEDPQVPNYGKSKTGVVLKPGMVLAVEPMVNIGDYRVEASNDGFGFRTVDGFLSAHFEHTVIVTEKGFDVATAL